MKNITQEELDRLDSCQSPQDWRDACDAIKEARAGMYPDDWWQKVKQSGMMDRILSRWDEDSDLKTIHFTDASSLCKYMADGKYRSE